jgi:hypothetical protein
MSDAMKSGLGALAFSAVLIGVIAFNFFSGDAHFNSRRVFDRRNDAYGFWLVQIGIGFFVVLSILMAALIFTGRMN